MKRLVIALSLTVAFLVGCLTATVASNFVVPPIKAGTNPQKWEYTCFRKYADLLDETKSLSDKLGSQGWEMSSTAGGPFGVVYCFKRPLT